MARNTQAVLRAILLGVMLVLLVIAYYPFRWDPPRTVRNDVTRTATGALHFGQMNEARTRGTPGWLSAAQASGNVAIEVSFSPGSQSGSASVMMLASDFWHTDFSIGQAGPDLLVWVRRPGSDANGDPPYTVHGAMQANRWTDVDVVLRNGAIRVGINGRPRLTGHLPPDFARSWGPGEIALGDEVHGGRAWQGQIRMAAVRTTDGSVDYVRPAALSIPASYFYAPDHIEPFPPAGLKKWLIVVLDMLSFVPLGFLLVAARRPPTGTYAAALIAAAYAVALAAGKFLFYARHTSLGVVLGQVAGGLLGAVLASRLARARHTARKAPR